jgi:Holliday junction resolvasome RuvABC endonuclease subunit
MNPDAVTDVTDHTYKTVTRAHVRACGADKELSVTSVTPVTNHPVLMQEAGELLRCILALDLGTTTGWALRTHEGLITSGTALFRPGRFDGGGMRYLRFTNWLTEIDRLSGPIAAIWFEEVRAHKGVDASHVFGGLMATLTAWAELRGIPYSGTPVGTIKRHATGKGNAPKTAMIAAVRARGFSPADDNEADAIAILLWALETRGGVQ